MPRLPVRRALGLAAIALLLACRRDRPAPVDADAAAAAAPVAPVIDAAPALVETDASGASADAPSAPASVPASASAAEAPRILAPSRPSAIVQCTSSALSYEAAAGLADDAALACPLTISDRTQRPPWRGTLDAPLTKQRRAVAGVAKDDCCYAMAGSAGTHRPR